MWPDVCFMCYSRPNEWLSIRPISLGAVFQESALSDFHYYGLADIYNKL